jgi:hypothetical protein
LAEFDLSDLEDQVAYFIDNNSFANLEDFDWESLEIAYISEGEPLRDGADLQGAPQAQNDLEWYSEAGWNKVLEALEDLGLAANESEPGTYGETPKLCEESQPKILYSLTPIPNSTHKVTFVANDTGYPLRNSVILDCGATAHITNDRSRYTTYHKLQEPKYLLAGVSDAKIYGFGTALIKAIAPGGLSKSIQLKDCLHIPNFRTTVVLYHRLEEQGIWWDTRKQILQVDNDPLCMVFK